MPNHAAMYIDGKLRNTLQQFSLLYINIPFIKAVNNSNYVFLIRSLVLDFAEKCYKARQLFFDDDVCNTVLSPELIENLIDVIYIIVVYHGRTQSCINAFRTQIDKFMTTSNGEQNIANLYKYCVSKSKDINMQYLLNVLFMDYKTKLLAVDVITTDDIKDLFDI